jgi:phosphatidylserine/phosphatidylglycerophosphate/cardiolipin synthase-like enzyme
VNVTPLIIRELERAEDYIRIAIFQIHREDVFKTLLDKRKKGVRVEILTLPYDSINEDVRPQVEPKLRELERTGALVYFDKWNVGDPSRTTTAVGRWYSFHGKFIVTDKSAIALSANLTQGQELDAAIIFRGVEKKIKEFNVKFEQLLALFVAKDNGFDGSVRRRITSVVGTEHNIFELPRNVDSRHKDHWIRHYPVEMCPSDVPIQERFYITPFDCKGRDLLSRLIQDASEYAYISTESFTDEDFSSFLVSTAVNSTIDVKILSGAKSMDFTDRLGSMFRNLLAQEIEVRTTSEDIHAKLVITDKVLAVSSVNLNKINLGFHQTRRFWRENTETILLCRNPTILECAKKKYLQIFDQSSSVGDKLSEKLENLVKGIFKETFQLHPNPDVRALLAKFILKKQIEVKRLVIKIGKVVKKLMEHYHRTTIEREDLVSALVLYYLSDRKQDLLELKEKLDEIDNCANLPAILNRLEFARLIEKEDGSYKINVEALVS